MLKALFKGVRTVRDRLRTQGVRTTALWAYARGLPKLTGVPLLEYSRVTDSLYVGPQFRKSGMNALLRAGITHTVNMRLEFDDAKHGLTLGTDNSIYYCHLPTIDDEPISAEAIAKGIEFIECAIRNGGKVYIHCSAGVGRAPSMAAAYLISNGYCTEDALDLIRVARPFIRPTARQIQALKEFETSERLRLEADQSERPATQMQSAPR